MRQKPISWKCCVRGAARSDAVHLYMGNRGHSRANTCAKTRLLGRVVFAARRGVARVILTWVTLVILELIHAPKPDLLEWLCSRRRAARVILTWVTVVILERIHSPKPDNLEGLCSRRGAVRSGSYLHG